MPSFLGNIFSKNQSATFVKKANSVVQLANSLAITLEGEGQTELQKRVELLKAKGEEYLATDNGIAEVFALVREAARRTLKERHYDVQLIGGLALAKGSIAEMRTGEGKTLVATLPTTLFALYGKGVHMVTVNDYLARRDAAWMGQVYDYLGLSVGVVTSSGAYLYDHTHTSEKEDEARDESASFRVFYDYLRPATKKEAYAADITYATNNELGFDYLRDNTAYDAGQIVQRGHHFAIVDEIDSILIDEARTPLIISGPAGDAEGLYEKFANIARSFVEGEDYTVDEKQRAVSLTALGIAKAEDALSIENLYTEGGMKFAHHLETAIRAKALFHKDKEYVVRDGTIVIVDEFTGRLQAGRRWSEGLHQAVEAKEGVPVQKESRTYASVTFQNLFRMYGRLCGMTGTALSSEEEFYTVYGLDVVVVPTHRPIRRIDLHDLIFQTQEGKYTALTQAVKKYHENEQPVLVGTVSIEDNEVISQYLTKAGVPHEVLNAKNHEREGELIAQAGRLGRVTVATNLAGRGVDIKLGGAPVSLTERDLVMEKGGLVVLGTERHDARRIDNQLRGRSGRQGDPGLTQFYVSLEDKLMRVFASDLLKNVMGGFKLAADVPLESGMISKTLETAQKRIEGFNFDSRKQVLAYDDVLNTQRLSIYAVRRTILLGDREELHRLIDSYVEADESAKQVLEEKILAMPAEVAEMLLRRVLLQIIDMYWLEQLETMDYLRRSVSLRAYGQRDPLIEYRKEGLQRFKDMEANIKRAFIEALPRIQISDDTEIKKQEEKVRASLVAASEGEEVKKTPLTRERTPGRNELVTLVRGGESREVKFKKVDDYIKEGWSLK